MSGYDFITREESGDANDHRCACRWWEQTVMQRFKPTLLDNTPLRTLSGAMRGAVVEVLALGLVFAYWSDKYRFASFL
jgi:hypothetical protein